jgi:aminoglycoside phosphotransferase (APT) family kinase protein/putative sterol carrier protein
VLSHDVDLEELRARLLPWLREKMPEARDLSIEEMVRTGAGFANVSIPFTLRWSEGGREQRRGMLFRGAGSADPVYPDPKLERQFRVMQCLEHTKVPVPRVFWLERREEFAGFPFYLMSRIDGLVPSEYPPYHSAGICYEASPEQRGRMWWSVLEAMTWVHGIDWRARGLAFLGAPPAGTGPLDQELDYYERYLDWARGEDQPILEAALGWLRSHRYVPERVTLCWGDARLPNAMFTPEGGLLALLDWDMAVLGDPISDLAFIIEFDRLLSHGTGVSRLEGLPSCEETVRRYEELTGWKVENFHYNQIFAVLRAGIVILRVLKNLQKLGVALPGEDPLRDNMCTQRLAELLELPPPSAASPAAAEDAGGPRVVQLRLSGPGGGDWHVVAQSGAVRCHPGEAPLAHATLAASAQDWVAMQRGEIDRFNAWTSGRLTVTGDGAVYQQLAEAIGEAWAAAQATEEEA